MLKDEGNALHKAGRHSEALAKYETAISNVSGLSSTEAVELKTSCELNKAMCHLKLEQWAPCEQVCSAVLTRAFLLSPCTASATNHARISRLFLLLLNLRVLLFICYEDQHARDTRGVHAGGSNLKAYYRRGQAHMGLQAWPAAAKDLKRALNMCPAGDAQADLISDKLTQALSNCPEGADVSVDARATEQHPKLSLIHI